MSDEPYENLKLIDAENSAVLHVIPDWFKISIFKYDLDHYRYEQRYTYTYKYVQDQYGNDVRVVDSVEDKGYGWWYPGEPESGEHKRQ